MLISYTDKFLAISGWLMIALLWQGALVATGIQDIAPTAADAPVMLETGRPGFGIFADFESPADRRLVVSIRDASEVLFIGLAPEYRDSGNPFSSDNFSRYRFRIRQITEDGTNPIVHGPFTIDNNNANVNSYDEAVFGAYEVSNTQFGDSIYVFRPTVEGDYSIEFDEFTNDGSSRVAIPFWDFTVIRNGAPVTGRLWSRGWAFRTPQVNGDIEPDCVWDRQFNGELFSYTEDGFVSRIDFANSGLQGLSFNVAFNDRGPGTSGDLTTDRQSVPQANATSNAAQHRIFLQLPDPFIFEDGACGEVTTASAFTCTDTEPYCLEVAVTRPGQVEVLLDFNGNGQLDPNTEDVTLLFEFTEENLSTCIPWNGLRGDGVPVTFTDTVDVVVNYTQGVQHWSAFDIEFMRNGFCVETVRPVCTQALASDELYWDDRNIPQDSGTGSPKDNRNGNSCIAAPRTWSFFELNNEQCDGFDDALTEGYGDKNTLNTWWFASSNVSAIARVPVISATIEGATNICAGDVTTLTAADPAATGEVTFAWTGPGVDGATTAAVEVDQAGEYCVTIMDEAGCSNETCTTITVLDFEADQFPENLTVCFGESVALPAGGDPGFSYQWSPAIGISSTTSNQPIFNPTVTTTYSVRIIGTSATGTTCETTEMVTVEVFPDIGLVVTGGGPICDATTTIRTTTLSDAQVQLFGPDGNLIDTGTEFVVPVSGDVDYTLVATNVQGCVDSANFTVSGGPVDIAPLPDTLLTCLSDGVTLGVTNLDQNDVLTFSWAPAELFTPESVNTANPVFIGAPGDYNVTVAIENQYGCTLAEEVQLILIDDGGMLSFVPTVDCDGRTVSFENNSTVDFGFRYDFGDGTTSTEAAPTHVYQSTGTFTVTLDLIYDQDCVASFSTEVTTSDAIVAADFNISLEECREGVATLRFTDASVNETSEGLTYAWTFGGATPATAITQNPEVTVTTTGTVTASLDVTTTDGCTATKDTTFTVDLAVVDLPAEITICPGETAALNPGGDTSLIYNWSPAPDFMANEANPVTATAGTYAVTVTSNNADITCLNTDTVVVIVPDSIGLQINGPDGPLTGTDGGPGSIELPTLQTCGTPEEVTVTVMTNDDVTVTYTDLEGNVLGMGGSFTVNPTGRDTIVATGVSEFGCVERDTFVIINNQVDAGIDVGTDGISVCSAADTAVAVVNFDPDDVLTYAWAPNDIINGPLDGPSVDITGPQEGTVELSVTVTNQFGCDTVLMVPVTVLPFTPNMYPDTIRPCFGDPFTINGGMAVAGYTYEWTPADNLDLSDPANPIGTFTENGALMVTITDPMTGCSAQQTVVVDTAPEIAFGVDPAQTNLCGTGLVTVAGSSVNEAVVITWYSDPELTTVVGNGPTFVIDANMMGETFTVFGEALDTITGCSQVIPASVSTTVFTPNDYPSVIRPCFGEEFVIVGGEVIPDYVYEWSPEGDLDLSDPANPIGTFTENGALMVTITDPATGCTETRTINVEVAPEIGFTATPQDTTLCTPGTVTVTGNTVNAVAEIVWFDDETLTNEVGRGNTFIIDAAEPGQRFTVFGVATDPVTGCTQVVSTTVVVSGLSTGLPPATIDACAGEQPGIFGPDGATGGFEYSYEPAGAVDVTNPNNPVFVGNESTEITVTATDPATGCTTTTTVSVNITDLTGLEGMATPAQIFVGDNAELVVVGCDDCTYEWFPQDGTVVPTTGSTVTATPTEAGTFVYEVDVTRNGCTETITIELRVEDPICDPENIFIPNAFTPNGDNVNDVLRVRSRFPELLTEFRFIIYNRWGQEVYSSSDINEFWDGTTDGDDLEPDVYGYWLRVRCPSGEELIQQGNITIQR